MAMTTLQKWMESGWQVPNSTTTTGDADLVASTGKDGSQGEAAGSAAAVACCRQALTTHCAVEASGSAETLGRMARNRECLLLRSSLSRYHLMTLRRAAQRLAGRRRELEDVRIDSSQQKIGGCPFFTASFCILSHCIFL